MADIIGLVVAIVAVGFGMALMFVSLQRRVAGLATQLTALHAALRILAASQHVPLPVSPDAPDEGGGRFEYWENFAAMPTLPEASEIAPEDE